MARLETDPFLQAAVMLADMDGVSVQSVIERGQRDMQLRIARMSIQVAERKRAEQRRGDL